MQSDSEDEDAALYHLQRKQRRKWKRWSVGGREERPVIQGLWVHEVDGLKSGASSSAIIPPPPQFTDSGWQPCGPAEPPWGWACSCTDVCECVTGQSADPDDCELDQDSEWESENDPLATADPTFDLMHVSSASDVRLSDSAGGLLGCWLPSPAGANTPECVFRLGDLNLPDAVVDVLRGRVMQMRKTPASPLFKTLIKQALGEWRSSQRLHEGLIFHRVRHRRTTPSLGSDHIPALLLNPSSNFFVFSIILIIVKQLQPSEGQYREGEEYSVLHHIQNGSFGDVFCVQDTATGFTCAAKRVR